MPNGLDDRDTLSDAQHNAHTEKIQGGNLNAWLRKGQATCAEYIFSKF